MNLEEMLDRTNADMAPEERNKLLEAFRDPEMMGLFQDYMRELADPAVRAENEAYLTQAEREAGLGGVRPPGSAGKKLVKPQLWRVLSMRTTGKKDRRNVLLNVCTAVEARPITIDGSNLLNLPFFMSAPRPWVDVKAGGKDYLVFDFVVEPAAKVKVGETKSLWGTLVETGVDKVEKALKRKIKRSSVKELDDSFEGYPPRMMSVSASEVTPPKPKTAAVKSPEPLPEAKPKPAGNTPVYSVTERMPPPSLEGNQADARPTKLVVKVELPKLTSAATVRLDISDRTFVLAEANDTYALTIKLPYPVDGTRGKAKFKSNKRVLQVTLPVLPPSKEETARLEEMRAELARRREEALGADPASDEQAENEPAPVPAPAPAPEQQSAPVAPAEEGGEASYEVQERVTAWVLKLPYQAEPDSIKVEFGATIVSLEFVAAGSPRKRYTLRLSPIAAVLNVDRCEYDASNENLILRLVKARPHMRNRLLRKPESKPEPKAEPEAEPQAEPTAEPSNPAPSTISEPSVRGLIQNAFIDELE